MKLSNFCSKTTRVESWNLKACTGFKGKPLHQEIWWWLQKCRCNFKDKKKLESFQCLRGNANKDLGFNSPMASRNALGNLRKLRFRIEASLLPPLLKVPSPAAALDTAGTSKSHSSARSSLLAVCGAVYSSRAVLAFLNRRIYLNWSINTFQF